MTTPNKCEHKCWSERAPLRCLACGTRFVPSDVLEEAREAILARKPKYTCGNCQGGERVLLCEICLNDARILARIDLVLGK